MQKSTKLNFKIRFLGALVVYLTLLNTLQAQQINAIWSTMRNSNSGRGNIFSMSTSGTNYSVMKEFVTKITDGDDPFGNNMLLGPDGYLYGCTSDGGYEGYGNFFKIKTDGSKYTILKEFGYVTEGSYMYGKLLKASDGMLYGITYEGGLYDYGTVLKIDFNGNTTKLHDFKQSEGGYAYGGLVEGPDGYLYGTTYEEGTYDYGTLFKLAKNGDNFQVLHQFGGTDVPNDGEYPYFNDNVIVGNKLYGMTYSGGENGDGTIYRINLDGTGYEKIYDFNSNNDGPYSPYSPLYVNGGYIYGTTYEGGYDGYGAIFRFDPNTIVATTTPGVSSLTGFQKIMDFQWDVNGGYPEGYPLLFQGTDLYINTPDEGQYGGGVITKIALSDITYTPPTSVSGVVTLPGTKIIDLNPAIGSSSYGEIILVDGYFYILCNESGNGGLVKVAQNGSTYESLLKFYENNGSEPYAGLTKHPNGKMYGTTYYGGARDYGVIYSITENGTYTKEFELTDYNRHGQYLYGQLALASNGKLYGTTYYGGNNGYGLLFEFDPANKTYNGLVSFNYWGATGGYPNGQVITIPGDRLFFMTSNGGSGPAVGIVSIPGVGSSTTGVSFATSYSGNQPAYALPAYDPVSNAVYFVNYSSGSNGQGALYALTLTGTTPGVGLVYSFSSSNNGGTYPRSGLVATQGKIFGATYQGGSNSIGTIFSYDPASASNTITGGMTFIYNMTWNSGDIGSYPFERQFTLGPDGWVYGVTNNGSQYGNGSIFKFDPSLNTFTGSDFKVVRALNSNNDSGNDPRGTLVFSTACQNAPQASITTKDDPYCGLIGLNVNSDITGQYTTLQWFKNGNVLSGANARTLSFSSLSQDDAANYQIQATGLCGTSTSSNFSLSVKPTVAVSTTVTSVALCEFAPLVIPVVSSGAAVESVSWYKDGTELPYSGSTFALNAVSRNDAGTYTVKVTSACNTATVAGISVVVSTTGCITAIADKSETNVSIYPNPSNGTFTISLTEVGSYQIMNVTSGQTLSGGTLGVGSNTIQSNLTSGVYVLQVSTASGVKTVKLVVE